jgi:hypothetical protein
MVVACVALFVALSGSAMAALVVSSNSQIGPNTIYGHNKPSSANANIVQGSIGSADITSNGIGGGRITDKSLTGADLADDTLTGKQVNESSLGTVPNSADSAALGGNAPGAFFSFQRSASQRTSDCATSQQTWTACAPVTLVVPPGHLWYVTVITTVTANPGNANVEALLCPATDGPSCITGNPDRMTFEPNQWSNWTSTATSSYYQGTYNFNTAMKWPFVVPANSEAYTTTTIIVSDYRSAYQTGS